MTFVFDLDNSDIPFHKYTLNTGNGGFAPDKSRGPKAPRDLSGVKPTLYSVSKKKVDPFKFKLAITYCINLNVLIASN